MTKLPKYFLLISSTVLLLCLLCISCNNEANSSAFDPLDSTRKANEADSFHKAAENPDASIAYSFKDNMQKNSSSLIRMLVKVNKPVTETRAALRNILNKDEKTAVVAGGNDTSLIKTIDSIRSYKYFIVKANWDSTVFRVEAIDSARKMLNLQGDTKWMWRVFALKETNNSDIVLTVTGMDSAGNTYSIDNGVIPIKVMVQQGQSRSGFRGRYLWWIGGILLLALSVFFLLRKKQRPGALNPKIFFSYAWGTDDNLIAELYSSLKKDGFNVVKDKEDLHYKGTISTFMTDIGHADFVIVAISDKYLKSRFCMYELYQIYSNTAMKKDLFQQKIFPLRVEDINLSNTDITNSYIDFWEKEEQKWKDEIQLNPDSVTEEQSKQFQFIRRLVTDIGNILYYLSDINALNMDELKKNDFAAIKDAIREIKSSAGATD